MYTNCFQLILFLITTLQTIHCSCVRLFWCFETALKRRKTFTSSEVQSKRYESMCFSADNKLLLTLSGGPDYSLVAWQWEKSKMVANIKCGQDNQGKEFKMKYINVVLRKEDKKNRKLLLKSINRRKKRGSSAMYNSCISFLFYISLTTFFFLL